MRKAFYSSKGTNSQKVLLSPASATLDELDSRGIEVRIRFDSSHGSEFDAYVRLSPSPS